MSSRILMLIDGLAVLYRAFYAIRDLCTRAGEPTNALFGFVRMTDQMRAAWKPTHWSVVFDGGLPEARTGLLESYKAQRRPMPDALRGQIGLVEEYLDLAEMFWVRQSGQEADDVMASLAACADVEAERVLIATSDKDMYQLVSDKVGIVPVAGKGGGIGLAEVEVKMGVGPAQVVDWLALVGDSADNIPGVPGVGPKTAGRLLQRFRSLDNLWDCLKDVESEKMRETLAAHRDLICRNKEMVRLRRDLSCWPGWDAMVARPPRSERLKSFFERWELKEMARKCREPSLFPLE